MTNNHPNVCDCGAETEGKSADDHSPGCAIFAANQPETPRETDEVNSPSELARWAVTNMLNDQARAVGISRRVEGIIRAERACDSNAVDRAVLRPNTIKELRQSAIMIRTWIPEAFPESESGQRHFVRVVMESVAAVIERALCEYGVDAGLVNSADAKRAEAEGRAS